jgi:hypothetical protein
VNFCPISAMQEFFNPDALLKHNPRQVYLVVLLVFVVLCVISYKMCFSGSSTSNSTKIVDGSKVIVQSTSGGTKIPMTTTKESYNEMFKYWKADDKVGMGQMMLAGTMFMVDVGTQALVLDRTVSLYEVRIQSGEYNGNSGWIDINFVKLLQ